MSLDARDIQRLGASARAQIAAKIVATVHEERWSKYGAIKTTVKLEEGDYTFHSRAEARRFSELNALRCMGKIRNLKIQPHFTLTEPYILPTGEKIKREEYIADFSYEVLSRGDGWKLVVEDVKGVRTPMYERKKNRMLDVYGICVTET